MTLMNSVTVLVSGHFRLCFTVVALVISKTVISKTVTEIDVCLNDSNRKAEENKRQETV